MMPSSRSVLPVKTVAITPDPQLNVELEMPQLPFEEERVNPEPGSSVVSMVHKICTI